MAKVLPRPECIKCGGKTQIQNVPDKSFFVDIICDTCWYLLLDRGYCWKLASMFTLRVK